MGPIGWPETVFIVILALLLFGPKKLPELGRTLGKAITEFRRASAELRSTFDREMRNIERETAVVKENTSSHYQDSYNYDYSSYDTGTPYTPELETAATNPSIESASVPEGAGLTAAPESSTLTVTPAHGTVASGSLHEDAHNGSSAVGGLTAHAAPPDTLQS